MPPEVQQTCDVRDDPGSLHPLVLLERYRLPGERRLALPAGAPSPIQRLPAARPVPSSPTSRCRTRKPGPLVCSTQFAGKYASMCGTWEPGASICRSRTRLNREPGPVTASNILPTYLSQSGPGGAGFAAATLCADQGQQQLRSGRTGLQGGFNRPSVVGFENYGYSNYNGLQTQLTRNFTNGLQFQAAWTWSHAIDNSTADVFSTVLTPRRPQDFQCFACDYSTSALDRRHRFTLRRSVRPAVLQEQRQLVHEERGRQLAIRAHLHL